MAQRVHAIKLVFSDGIIEDIKEGMVITRDGETMSFDAVNVLPQDQILLVAITLHQLYQEYFEGLNDQMDAELMAVLIPFIKGMLDAHKRDKGDVLQ